MAEKKTIQRLGARDARKWAGEDREGTGGFVRFPPYGVDGGLPQSENDPLRLRRIVMTLKSCTCYFSPTAKWQLSARP